MSGNLQDAIRAWNDYQATGLHVTQDEADDWLAKLEAGHDVAPPVCRVDEQTALIVAVRHQKDLDC
ncbi:MAG: hypothetical protein PHQ58_03375 [Rhodoferax sp.]|uniref:hypothetical protein n=1 Tax=Rhodoferax sp. TaxID=50421 RepID=UPI002636D2FF|nr:hypothetical protein [Rhodoferax sp.]MDD2879453.1 hypothetical protein [Rhodoferax sp.]